MQLNKKGEVPVFPQAVQLGDLLMIPSEAELAPWEFWRQRISLANCDFFQQNAAKFCDNYAFPIGSTTHLYL